MSNIESRGNRELNATVHPSSFDHIRTIVNDLTPLLAMYATLAPKDIPQEAPDSLTRKRLEEKFGLATLLKSHEEIEDKETTLPDDWKEKIKRYGSSGFSIIHEKDKSYARTIFVVSPLGGISVQMQSLQQGGDMFAAGMHVEKDECYSVRLGQGEYGKLHGQIFTAEFSPKREVPLVRYHNEPPFAVTVLP